MSEIDKQKWLQSPGRREMVMKVGELLSIAYPSIEEKSRIMEILNQKLGFFECPASAEFHGSNWGGLLQHSLLVYEKLKELAKMNPIFKLSDQTIIRTALFHDLCKCNTYEPNMLKTGVSEKKPFKFNDKNPVGYHGDKSLFLCTDYNIELTKLEQIMIRYHMGVYGKDCPDWFLDRVKKDYPHIVLLSCADVIASTIESQDDDNGN